MPLESLNKLYDSVSKTYEIGDFNTFKTKMGNPDSRRKFYDKVSETHELGDFNTFEVKVSSSAPAIDPEEVLIDPDEGFEAQREKSFKNLIYESVKQQENSVAKNNPYGVNLPRKKTNIEKIKNLGGSVMMGSRSLLEFQDMETGMRTGEDIIDRTLGQANNDPAVFYSKYSGLPIESPEVQSFVKIVNQKRKSLIPKQNKNLQRLIEGLEAGRDNPQYIIKTASEPDAINKISNFQRPTSKFIGLTPVSAIEGFEERPAPEKRRIFKPTDKDVARFFNKRMMQEEIVKEKRKGLSERDAYRKVKSSVGATPPSVVDLAMEKSVSGAVFRIMNLDQTVPLDDYPDVKIDKASDMVSVDFLEQVISGAISMVMPADALLFGLGGKGGAIVGKKAIKTLPQLKRVARYADSAARIMSKGLKVPLPQVRTFAKEAVVRMTGGAGGFGAFDAGRNIVDQIELTGEVDVVEALESALKGIAVGGSVGFLGLAGAKAGNLIGDKTAKAGEFGFEVLGLGTVAPLIEGEEITKRGYVEAAGTIIGLKFLKQFSTENQRRITESLGEEIQRQTEISGRPMPEVANGIRNRLKTAVELAIEGKSPEKSRSPMLEKGIELTEGFKSDLIKTSKDPSKSTLTETGIDFKKIDVSAKTTKQLVKEGALSLGQDGLRGTKELGKVEFTPRNQTRPERLEIESDIRRLSSDMKTLEKNGVQQKVLDDMQISIDAKVEKLNEIVVERKDIDNLFTPPKPLTPAERKIVSTEQVAKDVVEGRIQFKERLENLEIELVRRDKAEIKRLENYLKEADLYNNPFEPNPLREVPLHPADAGRRKQAEIIASLKRREQDRALESLDLQKTSTIKTPSEKKIKTFKLQKQFSDLDLTIKNNESALSNPNLTPLTIERLKKSIQRAKELQRDTQKIASEEGIELQSFIGIVSPRKIKEFFGSLKNKPKSLRDIEVDRLYNQAQARLDKKIKDQNIKVDNSETLSTDPVKRGGAERVYNFFFSDMIERTASVGTKTSVEMARNGRKAIDATKEASGRLAEYVDAVLQLSGKYLGAEGKAVKDLSTFVNVDVGGGNKVLMSKLHARIEGLPVKVSKESQKIVEKMKDLIEERGRLYEEIGLMQEAKDGKIRPFKVIGRDVAPRIMTSEFYSIIEKGPSSNEFKVLVSEFSKASGAKESQVQDYFSEFRENFTGSGNILSGGVPSARPTRTTQAEHSRKWKHIPHAIKVDGQILPIVEHRPFDYARRLAETGSSRVGVAKVFGQELAGTSIINKAKEQIRKEGGSVTKFHEMIKALSGVPVEPSYIIGTSKATRAIEAGYDLIRTTSLSASAIPNLGEFLGSTRRFAGTPELIKALYQLKLGLPSAKAKQLENYLDGIGAITKDVANFSIDPQRPITSRMRALNELQRSAFLYRQINQLQEATAAVVALNKVEMYKRGKGKNIDKIFLREMGFSREDARLMVSGKAPQRLYDALIRRAPAHLTGGAQRLGEQSRIESNRIFKAVKGFETYAQMKIRSFNRARKTYVEVFKEGAREKNYGKIVDANRAMLSEIAGTAVAGLVAQFSLAYMYGGSDNVEIKYNEALENPLETLKDAWFYTAVAGMYGQILQATEGSVLDAIYPYTVITELYNATAGTGRYTYVEGVDRAIKFGERFAPVNKAFKNGLVAVGFGSPEARKTDNAIRAYYRWKIKNKYGGTYKSVPDEQIKNFRKNMIKAYNAMMDNKEPSEVFKFAVDAVSESGKDPASIARSLNGKRLLTKSKIAPGASESEYVARKNQLRKKIGEKAYSRLLTHDQLLEVYADLVSF